MRVGVDSPEDYAIALGGRLLTATPAATPVGSPSRSTPGTGSRSMDRSRPRSTDGGAEVRTTTVEAAAGSAVELGLTDLVVLKSTGSEFKGFLHDQYTTLTTGLNDHEDGDPGVEWNTAYDSPPPTAAHCRRPCG